MRKFSKAFRGRIPQWLKGVPRGAGQIAAGAAAILMFFGMSGVAQAGGSLSLVTLNTWGLPKPMLRKAERFQILSHALPEQGADIVVLQEAWTRKARPLARLPQYPFAAWGNSRGWIGGDGLLILSRHPITANSWRSFSQEPWNDTIPEKGILHARVLLPDWTEVDVYTTHLSAYDGNDPIRQLQIQDLLDFVADTRGNGPAVLAGDFNLLPGSEPYRYLNEVRGWSDTWADRHGEASPGYTWDPRKNKNTFNPRGKAKRFDYVWTESSGASRLRVTEASVIFDEPVQGVFLSDHFGLKVSMEY